MLQTILVTCVFGLCLSRRVDVKEATLVASEKCQPGALYRFDKQGKCRTDINNNGVLDRFAENKCCKAGQIAPPDVVINAEVAAEAQLEQERNDVTAAIAEKERLMREMEQKVAEQKAELERAEERARLWKSLVGKIQDFYDDCETFKNEAPRMDVAGISRRAQSVILQYWTLSKMYSDFASGFPTAEQTMQQAMNEIRNEGNRKTSQVDDRLCQLMHCSMPMSGQKQKNQIRAWISQWNQQAKAQVRSLDTHDM